ncbi:MAG: methyltransferase [Allosphingosinicella sp.]
MSSGDLDAALLDLLGHLGASEYRFITPTPETHRRVLGRRAELPARDLRDIFGWNQPFEPSLLPTALFDRLARSGAWKTDSGLCRSRVRVASVGDRLFLHSEFPTSQQDAVFFGPDSYRFVRFLAAELGAAPGVRHLVDIGTGAGVGAIAAARLLPRARLTLTDINPLALRYARINARHAGLEVELVEGKGLDGVAGPFDLAIANPPFILDAGRRTYRHGGDLHGAALSLEWALAAAQRVAPRGRVLLYTGSAIVDGVDPLEAALRAQLPDLGCALRYAELDPDIFGEQLDEPGYEDVERIAAVGAVIERRPPSSQ